MSVLCEFFCLFVCLIAFKSIKYKYSEIDKHTELSARTIHAGVETGCSQEGNECYATKV